MKKVLCIILTFIFTIFCFIPAYAADFAENRVVAGVGFYMVVKDDGSLWSWGDNYNGELGNGTNIAQKTPKKIMEQVESVSSAGHTLAIKTDGSLWAWGWNEYGQIGDGTTVNKKLPVKIMEQVKMASAGGSISAAIKEDGSLWAWGKNMCGPFGEGRPVKILDHVISADTGWDYIVAQKEDGSLWAWGYDNYTYDVLGEKVSKPTTWMKIMDDVKDYSAGLTELIIGKTDDTVWTDGYQSNSNQRDPNAPEITANHFFVKNGNWDMPMIEIHKNWYDIPDIDRVDSGFDFVGIITNNNELYTSRKGFTQGDNMTEYNKVMDDVVTFSAAWERGLALKEDGSVWYVEGISKVEKVTSVITGKKQPMQTKMAYTSSQKIAVNGLEVISENYLIDGNNYCKLRDIAYMMKNTNSAFDVGWSAEENAVVLTSGVDYFGSGGKKAIQNKKAQTATAKVILDGKEIDLKGYLIDGNNYFKLRDVMNVIGAKVEWNSTTATVDIYA